MHQRRARFGAVGARQHEGWARNRALHPERLANTAGQRGFAGAEFAIEQQQITGAQLAADALTQPLHRLGGFNKPPHYSDCPKNLRMGRAPTRVTTS